MQQQMNERKLSKIKLRKNLCQGNTISNQIDDNLPTAVCINRSNSTSYSDGAEFLLSNNDND